MEAEDKLPRQIVVSGQRRRVIFVNENGLYGMILSSKPSATIWTMRTNGVTIRYPIGRRQKVIFINKGRPDSGLPWRKTANGTADEGTVLRYA